MRAQVEENLGMNLFSVVGLFAKAQEVLFEAIGFCRTVTPPNYCRHTYFQLSSFTFTENSSDIDLLSNFVFVLKNFARSWTENKVDL